MKTLADWLAYQQQIHARGIDLGLDRVRAVWQRMGAPHPAPVVITVGGTNGKGSTVAFLEAMLRAGGMRVGAYTSPHILRYNERVRVDGAETDDAALVAAFERIEAVREDVTLTYFEFGTLAAFDLFARAKVDVALLEIGLGGRLDAVNIIDADCAVVVTVDLDHMEYLGPDRDAIGREKAGIFRAGRPAIVGETNPPGSLLEHARAIGAQVEILGRDFGWAPRPQADPTARHPGGSRDPVTFSQRTGMQRRWVPDIASRFRDDEQNQSFPRDGALEWWHRDPSELRYIAPARHVAEVVVHRELALEGAFQYHNAATAIAALHALGERVRWRVEAIEKHARESAAVPLLAGRLQHLAASPDLVVDVGHNPQAARELARWLDRHPVAGVTRAVFGALADKDVEGVVTALGARIDHWYLAGLVDESPRGETSARLAARLHAVLPHASCAEYPGIPASLAAARAAASPDDRIIAFGSFHVVAPVLRAYNSGNPERLVAH